MVVTEKKMVLRCALAGEIGYVAGEENMVRLK
jgi:hypothetical protein